MSYLRNFIPYESPSYYFSTAQERYGDKRKLTPSEIAEGKRYEKELAKQAALKKEAIRAESLQTITGTIGGLGYGSKYTPEQSGIYIPVYLHELALGSAKERRLSAFYGAHPGLRKQQQAAMALERAGIYTRQETNENGIFSVTYQQSPTGKKGKYGIPLHSTKVLKSETIHLWTPKEKIEYKVSKIVSSTHAPRWEGGPAGTVGRASIPSKAEIQFLRENRPDLLRPGSPIYNVIKGELLKVYAGNPQILRELRRYDPSLFGAPTVKVAIGHPTVMLPAARTKQLEDIRKKKEAEYIKQLEARQKAMKAAGLSITRQAPILKTIGVFKIK